MHCKNTTWLARHNNTQEYEPHWTLSCLTLASLLQFSSIIFMEKVQSVQKIANKNEISNANVIYTIQTLDIDVEEIFNPKFMSRIFLKV